MTMTFTPIDPLYLAALVALAFAALVDISITGQITYRTPLWAFLFIGGFWVNYTQGGQK